eukprot:m.157711 g.157711  ORF g.157711 m.157711 type:complete len:1047 (+) comp16455_c0_seq2:45-3185(+)
MDWTSQNPLEPGWSTTADQDDLAGRFRPTSPRSSTTSVSSQTPSVPSKCQSSSSLAQRKAGSVSDAVVTLHAGSPSDGAVNGIIHLHIHKASDLAPKDTNGKADPYINIFLDGDKVGQTRVVPETLNPTWEQSFEIYWYAPKRPSYLWLKMFDKDRLSDDFMGQLAIPVAGLHKHRFSGYRSLLRTSRRETISGVLYFEISVTNTSSFSTEHTRAFQDFCQQQNFNCPVLTEAERVTQQSSLQASIHEDRLLYPVAEDDPIGLDDSAGLELSLSADDTKAASAEETKAESADDTTPSSAQTASLAASTTVERPPVRSIPDSSEVIEMCIGPVILSQGKRRSLGWLYLSSYRLVAMSQSLRYSEGSPTATPPATSQPVSPFPSSGDLSAALCNTDGGSDINMAIPHGLLNSINLEISSRSHYSTQVGEVATPQAKNKRVVNALHAFSPWRSRKSDLDSSNDGSETDTRQPSSRSERRAMNASVVVTIVAKDVRAIRVAFPSSTLEGYRLALNLAQTLVERVNQLIANTTANEAALSYGPGGRDQDWHRFDPLREMQRQIPSFDHTDSTEGPLCNWVKSDLNETYELCASYPRTLFFPRMVGAELIKQCADFRSKHRLPALTWARHAGGRYRAIVRCAQPLVGARSRRSKADEDMLQALMLCSDNKSTILIFDARSVLAAGGNQLMGKGTENEAYYENAKLNYMDIGNIHTMRQSQDKLVELCLSGSDTRWYSNLEATGWLGHIKLVLSAARSIATKVEQLCATALVHCSDGWDRTAQLVTLAQVMVDPYFRTLDGLIVLIEKDWLAFGHKFDDRHGGADSLSERSPVFLQFLECVWQMLRQFPSAFEYNTKLLVFIADHSRSGWFGNFMCNTDRARRSRRIDKSTTSLWSAVEARRKEFTESAYVPGQYSLLHPSCSLKKLVLWEDFYLRYDLTADDDNDMPFDADTVIWVQDEEAPHCHSCHVNFNLLRRRHHCRACGHIFCSTCSSRKLLLPQYSVEVQQRVCEACFSKWRMKQRDVMINHEPAVVSLDTSAEGEDDDESHSSTT